MTKVKTIKELVNEFADNKMEWKMCWQCIRQLGGCDHSSIKEKNNKILAEIVERTSKYQL